ncbi:MAG: DUF3047 domain-containing protein [Candidatus Omnitrophica bacterium]|nr:DUF3047 domain-containing protein [Candidatus Omnitrophota bacterium]
MLKTKKAKSVIFLILTLIIITGSLSIFAAQFPKIFRFGKKNALDEWEEKIFKGRVLYTVKLNKAGGYLSAESKSAASGILYNIEFDPKKTPMISWKWKVLQFPKKRIVEEETEGWIEQDDYAARLYVIFPRFSFALTKSLEYVWARDIPEGTIISSPYSANIKIIVAQSGGSLIKRWVSEERNVYEDFKKAFGKKPGKVGAIAIMTDTDNTQSTAEANYDEIKVGYKDGE